MRDDLRDRAVTYIGPRTFAGVFALICAVFGGLLYAAPQLVGSLATTDPVPAIASSAAPAVAVTPAPVVAVPVLGTGLMSAPTKTARPSTVAAVRPAHALASSLQRAPRVVAPAVPRVVPAAATHSVVVTVPHHRMSHPPVQRHPLVPRHPSVPRPMVTRTAPHAVATAGAAQSSALLVPFKAAAGPPAPAPGLH